VIAKHLQLDVPAVGGATQLIDAFVRPILGVMDGGFREPVTPQVARLRQAGQAALVAVSEQQAQQVLLVAAASEQSDEEMHAVAVDPGMHDIQGENWCLYDN